MASRIHSSMTTTSISARAPVESASTGVRAILLQTRKTAIVRTQAAMDDRVYRAMVAIIQNFTLSIEGCLLELVSKDIPTLRDINIIYIHTPYFYRPIFYHQTSIPPHSLIPYYYTNPSRPISRPRWNARLSSDSILPAAAHSLDSTRPLRQATSG
jgi:hypothetical protein